MDKSNAATRELAIFGNQPAFSHKLHVNRPNAGDWDAFLAHLEGMLDRRWFANHGPLVDELEERLAHFLGVKHCVLTCNGTMALELIIRAFDLSGEIIVPSFTFVATPHAVLWQGIEPVFCDIDPETWNIDPSQCDALVTNRTAAILGVHLWGRPCDTVSLAEIAGRHNLRLLFDAAHAMGCSHNGRMLGGFGDAEAFSFHATKVFHTFEGGAVTTNDDELAGRIRLLSNFGFTDIDQIASIGTNAKMPEASAAMGLTNLESLDAFIEANRRNYDGYRTGLEDIPGIHMVLYDEAERNNFQYVVVEVIEEDLGLSRDQVMNVLHAENVFARRYFYPGCHRAEPYASRWPEADARLPNTNCATRRVLVLPAGGGVKQEQVGGICAILRLLGDEAGAVRSALENNDSLQSRLGAVSAAPAGQLSPAASRGPDPKVEIRIPISPRDNDLLMLRFFLESLQEFGGPLGRAAHCVTSVSAEGPVRDLKREYGWTREHSLEFSWVDEELFKRSHYDATGFDRMWIKSDADVVLLLDVDLLIAGDFDQVVLNAYRDQRLSGFIAHVSPFGFPGLADTPSEVWWTRIFEEAGLPKPSLEWEYTGYGLDWDAIYPGLGISNDPRHRCGPAYFNYGVVVSPRVFVERMGETFEAELDAVDRVLESGYRSQIANCLAFARHGIPCETLSINYNFPLNVPGDAIRALNPDPNGEDSDEDIKIFHYIGGREHFATRETVEVLLNRSDLTGAWLVFQRKLERVHARIAG